MESADVDLIRFNVSTGEINSVTELDRMSLYFAASPTGQKVVTVGWDGIQIIDLQRGDIRRISGEGANGIGDWLPGGAGILGSMYSGETGGADIYAFDPDGIDEPKVLIDREESAFYATLSPDQSTLMWYETSQETGRDLWQAPVEIDSGEIRLTGEAELWYAGRNDDVHPDWHPSGGWILYAANHTGEYQIYLRAYPSARDERPVSLGTGYDPTWNEDGSAIFYRTGKSFMQVDVLNSEAMELSQPRELLDLQSNRIGVSGQLNRVYTVNPVTGELLFNQFRGARKQPGLVYIQNWKALLE
jgi:Tol biopolymer transport system component